jgi:hypothetical protein
VKLLRGSPLWLKYNNKEVDNLVKPCYNTYIDNKELTMLKLIGWCTVVWAMFYFGIAQLIAIYFMVVLSYIAGV